MAKKLPKITWEEFKLQAALGTLPLEYQNPLFLDSYTSTAKGYRRCHFCHDKIKPGTDHYVTRRGNMNMCKDCIYVSIGKILRDLIDDTPSTANCT